jgi:3-methyladenine DNA glycosylase AlkD
MPRRVTSPTPIRAAIAQELQALANPERAVQQQAYMKSTMPYAGLTAPILRNMSKTVFTALPIQDDGVWQSTIEDLWRNAEFREMRYCAIDLLLLPRYRKAWLTPSKLGVIREMVETGAWWDYVDNLASNAVGDLLRRYPDVMFAELREWAQDSHLWVRRSAILAQLKFNADTNEAFLFEAIEGSIEDRDFFARKAIGWALRQYSRTAPDAVIDYIERNRSRMSPLSRREGSRILVKQGRLRSTL